MKLKPAKELNKISEQQLISFDNVEHNKSLSMKIAPD